MSVSPDPVYREHLRVDLERGLRECRRDHRDLWLDIQRLTAERDQLREARERALDYLSERPFCEYPLSATTLIELLELTR